MFQTKFRSEEFEKFAWNIISRDTKFNFHRRPTFSVDIARGSSITSLIFSSQKAAAETKLIETRIWISKAAAPLPLGMAKFTCNIVGREVESIKKFHVRALWIKKNLINN